MGELTLFVYNVEEGFLFLGELELLGGRLEVKKFEVVLLADDLNLAGSLHGLFGQVATLVVEQAVRVAAPGNALHQNPRGKC